MSSPKKGIQVTGSSDINLLVAIDSINEEISWQIQGRWIASSPRIIITPIDLTLYGFSVYLPLDFASASYSAHPQDGEKGGRFNVKKILWEGMSIDDVGSRILSSRNHLHILDPISFNVWGGSILARDIKLDNIMSDEASIQTSIYLDGIDLKHVFQNTQLPVSGTLDGNIPSVRYRYKSARADFEGSLQIKTMGGTVSAEGFFIERPFSRGVRLGGSIIWEDILLEKLTQKIPIGKISGVISGKLTGLEIEYGQPARFLLEVRSGKRRGIKQKISVEAINNISLIGTGSSGVQRVLNTGLNRLFSFYPYSKIAFRCTLDNDVFSLRGLIHEGDKEFLVRKALFRGIDIINQNPENTISFKDMSERIKRVFEKRGDAVKR